MKKKITLVVAILSLTNYPSLYTAQAPFPNAGEIFPRLSGNHLIISTTFGGGPQDITIDLTQKPFGEEEFSLETLMKTASKSMRPFCFLLCENQDHKQTIVLIDDNLHPSGPLPPTLTPLCKYKLFNENKGVVFYPHCVLTESTPAVMVRPMPMPYAVEVPYEVQIPVHVPFPVHVPVPVYTVRTEVKTIYLPSPQTVAPVISSPSSSSSPLSLPAPTPLSPVAAEEATREIHSSLSLSSPPTPSLPLPTETEINLAAAAAQQEKERAAQLAQEETARQQAEEARRQEEKRNRKEIKKQKAKQQKEEAQAAAQKARQEEEKAAVEAERIRQEAEKERLQRQEEAERESKLKEEILRREQAERDSKAAKIKKEKEEAAAKEAAEKARQEKAAQKKKSPSPVASHSRHTKPVSPKKNPDDDKLLEEAIQKAAVLRATLPPQASAPTTQKKPSRKTSSSHPSEPSDTSSLWDPLHCNETQGPPTDFFDLEPQATQEGSVIENIKKCIEDKHFRAAKELLKHIAPNTLVHTILSTDIYTDAPHCFTPEETTELRKTLLTAAKDKKRGTDNRLSFYFALALHAPGEDKKTEYLDKCLELDTETYYLRPQSLNDIGRLKRQDAGHLVCRTKSGGCLHKDIWSKLQGLKELDEYCEETLFLTFYLLTKALSGNCQNLTSSLGKRRAEIQQDIIDLYENKVRQSYLTSTQLADINALIPEEIIPHDQLRPSTETAEGTD
jgi:actin-related protein